MLESRDLIIVRGILSSKGGGEVKAVSFPRMACNAMQAPIVAYTPPPYDVVWRQIFTL